MLIIANFSVSTLRQVHNSSCPAFHSYIISKNGNDNIDNLGTLFYLFIEVEKIVRQTEFVR